MADDRKAGAAAGISIGAAILAAVALSKRAQAAPPGGELVIPKELIDLVIAIAASSEQIDGGIQELTQELSKLAINVQGWPANTDSITATRVTAPVAGVRLPHMTVPSGMSLVIKAWPNNPAAGLVQVGASMGECVNVNQSFPLAPGEVVAYQVQNANQIYVAANMAGCFACLTVEQRRSGGA